MELLSCIFERFSLRWEDLEIQAYLHRARLIRDAFIVQSPSVSLHCKFCRYFASIEKVSIKDCFEQWIENAYGLAWFQVIQSSQN